MRPTSGGRVVSLASSWPRRWMAIVVVLVAAWPVGAQPLTAENAAAFPEPAVVAADHPDELRRAAALQVLAKALADSAGQPLPAAAAARIKRYEAAWMAINPRSRSDYTARLDAIDRLRRSKAFQAEVLGRYTPALAGASRDALQRERYLARLEAAKRDLYRGSAVVGVLLLPLPWLLLGLGHVMTRGSPTTRAAVPGLPALPDELARVRLFATAFNVHAMGARITTRERYETTVTKTTRYEGVQHHSGAKDPDAVATSKSTTITIAMDWRAARARRAASNSPGYPTTASPATCSATPPAAKRSCCTATTTPATPAARVRRWRT